MRWSVIVGLAWLASCAVTARAVVDVKDVPLFKVRARVVAENGAQPKDTAYSFGISGVKGKAKSVGAAWSDDLVFDLGSAIDSVKGYPNSYLKRYPVVLRLSVRPASSNITVEAQVRWQAAETPKLGGAEETDVLDEFDLKTTPPDVTVSGDLFGPTLGLLLWREEGAPRIATMAEYNRRYWKELEGVVVPEENRPKRFPIVDRFIGGDHDRRAWREGILNLSRAGFSAIMLPPREQQRRILEDAGLNRTAWAVYNPPGYAFDYSEEITEASIREWAEKLARPYREAGYERGDVAMYTISDEPGWYFPKMFRTVAESPEGLERFRSYLVKQGLTPADVGHRDWSTVKPLGRSAVGPVTANRLFYWSVRFVAWDSARHFALCTRALEDAFWAGIPLPVNWNFFSGRFYFPGPFAHNQDKESPDCGMGSHDWFEFGRMRGTTCLWTEDWFGDGRAWQWSFYCSKLNSAARYGGVQFGGYVIPRTCGAREDGILQRILTIVGSGGKALKYFVFGPEYVFPGNCYSFKAQLLRKMAEAHGMIGAAEDVLWPGTRPRAEVAILQPRSAMPWDAIDEEIPTAIVDATNTALERRTVDYLAEVFGLYLALQHGNIPADWLDEDALTPGDLEPYKVVYVTEPNVPREGTAALVKWVRRGGTLVTVAGAAAYDRYNQRDRTLSDALGLKEETRERLLVSNVKTLETAGKGSGKLGAFTAAGVRSRVEAGEYTVIGTFEDGSPAVVERTIDKGRHLHFAWMPGMSYYASSQDTRDRLPAGFMPSLRAWCAYGATTANVEPPVNVDVPLVETPVLVSGAGAAVTLLNWTGQDQDRVELSVRAPFSVQSVHAVKAGSLEWKREGDWLRMGLPLGAADIVVIRPDADGDTLDTDRSRR